MSPSPPFVDVDTNTLDIEQIRSEAFPLLGLVVLFGALGLFPFAFALAFGLGSTLAFFFTLLTQLILAVGAGIILIYVVARGIQLADA